MRPEMAASQVARLLEEIAALLKLKGEKPFRTGAYEHAVRAGVPDLRERLEAATLAEIPGVGVSIAQVVTEYLTTGQSTVRDDIEASIPPVLRQLARLHGIGPTRAAYVGGARGGVPGRSAAVEGFGEKMQERVLQGVRHWRESGGVSAFA